MFVKHLLSHVNLDIPTAQATRPRSESLSRAGQVQERPANGTSPGKIRENASQKKPPQRIPPVAAKPEDPHVCVPPNRIPRRKLSVKSRHFRKEDKIVPTGTQRFFSSSFFPQRPKKGKKEIPKQLGKTARAPTDEKPQRLICKFVPVNPSTALGMSRRPSSPLPVAAWIFSLTGGIL